VKHACAHNEPVNVHEKDACAHGEPVNVHGKDACANDEPFNTHGKLVYANEEPVTLKFNIAHEYDTCRIVLVFHSQQLCSKKQVL